MISVEVNILSFRTLISGFHYPECAASDLAVVNLSGFQVSRLILQHCGQEEKRGECEKHLIKNGLFQALIWLQTQLQNLDHTLLFVLLAATQLVTPPRHSVNKDTFSGATKALLCVHQWDILNGLCLKMRCNLCNLGF